MLWNIQTSIINKYRCIKFPNELAFEWALTWHQVIIFGNFITILLRRSSQNHPVKLKSSKGLLSLKNTLTKTWIIKFI